MLERREFGNGVAAYVSPLLSGAGVPHAFSTRIGGVSVGPRGAFSSLNFGNPADAPERDPPANIRRNENLLMKAALLHAGADVAAREFCRVYQVHGAGVATLRPGGPADFNVKADAIVSDDPARFVSVRVADCVPILIASRDGSVVGAVHAGWRGLVAGVIRAAVDELRGIGGLAGGRDLIAAVGPCIGIGAFEVGQEVVDAFASAGIQLGAAVVPGRPGKHHIDLRLIAAEQLLAAGIRAERIDTTDRCTGEHDAEFFSHRRERGMTGRMAAIIGAVRVPGRCTSAGTGSTPRG